MQFDINKLLRQIKLERFHTSVEELEIAYRAARQAPEADRERVEEHWAEFQKEVAAGRAEEIETEEGHVFSSSDHFSDEFDTIDTVIGHLRDAFVVALHS